jgi:hypothetical protein
MVTLWWSRCGAVLVSGVITLLCRSRGCGDLVLVLLW